MFEFIRDNCVRADSMKLSDFCRALKAAGYKVPRTEIVAALSRQFSLTTVGNQTWIVGLSLRNNKEVLLREFINRHCFRADGLQTKLASFARAVSSFLSRDEVIQYLHSWGFHIESVNGAYVVHGLGLKELEYA
jgi:hypothetical protein